MKALESLLPPNVVEAIGGTLMHAFWQLAALALALMLGLALVSRRAAQTRYWLGVSTMGLMLLLPIVTFAYLYEPAPAQPDGLTLVSSTSTASSANFRQPAFRPLPPITPNMTPRHGEGIMEEVSVFVQANAYLLVGLWLLGMGFFALRFAGGYWRVQRLRKQGLSQVDPDLQSRFASLVARMGFRRPIVLLQSTLIDTPLVIGVFKPMVLLPVGLLTGLSMVQVECVLVHELAHVRRWDFLVNILQSMVEILLFFHPAIWWISRLVRDERENCCDELVLRLQNNKVQYARALLSLETLRMRQPRMAMSSTGGALSRRIRRITGGDSREPRNYSRGLLLGFITVVGLLVLATQTRNVVMASMPAQPQHDTADLRKAVTVRTDGKLAQPVAPSLMKDNAVSPVDGIKVSLLPADFWKTLGNLSDMLRMVPAALDSPITKISIVEDGKEVVIAFDKEGNITSARRDGQVVSDADRARYQGMARQFFRGDADAPDPADMPGMPPMPAMPPMGAHAPMPGMPAMPPMSNRNGRLDDEDFEIAMKSWGEKMEAWGEQFAKSFEGEDWKQFEADMERWGEDIAQRLSGQNGEDEQRLADLAMRMGELSQQMEKAKTDEERDRIQAEMDEVGQKMEAHGEAIGARMEAWGERFGEKMEAWSERYAAEMEAMAERMEEEAERMDAEARRHDEEAEEEARGMESAIDVIGDELVDDGLIKDPRMYKLKINDEELYVDGDKQSKQTHHKYRDLIESSMGVNLHNGWATFNINKGNRKIVLP
jgi:bla regulator protein blaR1